MKEILISTEFIILGQLLKFSGIISNGSEAKLFILNNDIFVNDELEKRRGRKLRNKDIIVVNHQKLVIVQHNEN